MRLLAAALVLVLAVAGCSGSDADTSDAAATKAACTQVQVALTAQAAKDWPSDVAALTSAWRAGHQSAAPAVRKHLPAPGSLTADDSQTVNEVTDLLAAACGLPVNK